MTLEGRFCEATRAENIPLMDELVDRVDLGTEWEGIGCDLMIEMSTLGNLDIVRYFVDKGLFHYTVADVAITNGHYHILEWLLDEECLYPGDESCFSLVLDIIKASNLEMLKLIVRRGFSLGFEIYHMETLEQAIEYGSLEMIKFLFDNGARASGFNQREAIYFGRLDVIKYLVDQGANPRWCDDNLLIIACGQGSVEVVEYYLSKGLDADAWYGKAVRSVIENRRIDLLHILLKHGADITLYSDHAIKFASRMSCFRSIRVLLQHYQKIGKKRRYRDMNVTKVHDELVCYQCALYSVHHRLLPIELRAHILDYISFDNVVL